MRSAPSSDSALHVDTETYPVGLVVRTSRRDPMINSALWPFVFYGLGSICFFVGTVIAVWQILR